MNYRHSYHAGSFTDVFKHIVLIGLLDALAKKEKPFCYIDTHAGAGYYDLFSEAAQKGKEYQNGIAKIVPEKNQPKLIQKYLSVIRKFNDAFSGSSSSTAYRFYPGSPLVAQARLRPQDRMVTCELHPEEYRALKTAFLDDDHVAVHHMDGYLALKAFLPPKERRGLILIDPPYEKSDEFTRIVQSLSQALKRFETGSYAVWYPIKNPQLIQNFHHTLKTLQKTILIVELSVYPDDVISQLNGSGLAILNPPWQFHDLMEETLPWLTRALSLSDRAQYRLFLLK